MVFGTKSGAIQDFQRGKKHPINQTPLNPPRPPKTSPNPLNPLKIDPYSSPMTLMIISDGKEQALNMQKQPDLMGLSENMQK